MNAKNSTLDEHMEAVTMILRTVMHLTPPAIDSADLTMFAKNETARSED